VLVDAFVNITARYMRRARTRMTKAVSRQNVRRVLDAAEDSARRVIQAARATRQCPGCASRQVVQPLAYCGKNRSGASFGGPLVAAGCIDCGLLFSSPQPSERAVRKMYARQAVERRELAPDYDPTVRLQHHGVDPRIWPARVRAWVEREIHAAIGMEPRDAGAVASVHQKEVAADENLAIRLQRNGANSGSRIRPGGRSCHRGCHWDKAARCPRGTAITSSALWPRLAAGPGVGVG